MRSAHHKFHYLQLSRRKTVNILFSTAVILLLLNLAIDKIFLSRDSIKKEVSEIEIEKKFKTALFNFGLEKDWVKKIQGENNETTFAYKIDLPADLPVTLILKEINNLFEGDNVNIESEEERINGKTILKLRSAAELKLISEFRYNSGLNRNAGKISFLLLDILNLEENEDSTLLNSPELFDIVLIPSKESAEEAKKISRYGKRYGLLLNDEIPELKYNFKEAYSEARLKASVRDILSDFPEIKFIMIDKKSGLFSSKVFPFVEKEFLKRNLRLFDKNSLDLIDAQETEEIIKIFKRVADTKKRRNILISAQNFILLQPEIIKYKKTGCKFVEPVF
jgi:hypothetical protein